MSRETIYDYPRYYDILFSWDRSLEAAFYERAFERYGVAPGERILEVACGPGRVACLLAQRGWNVSGLDLSAGMLAFLRERAAAAGVRVETICADMTTFARRSGVCGRLQPDELLPPAPRATPPPRRISGGWRVPSGRGACTCST